MLSDITQEYLKSILEYNSETGLFTWLVKRGTVKVGDIAGNVLGKNEYVYINITIDGTGYLAHRLAHLYMTGEWPKNHIDHEDLNGLNNKWLNIRNATRSQNLGNQKIHSNNTSGFKGVSWDKQANKWMVRVQVDKKSRFIGYFEKDQLQEAASAYEKVATELFKEFARSA